MVHWVAVRTQTIHSEAHQEYGCGRGRDRPAPLQESQVEYRNINGMC